MIYVKKVLDFYKESGHKSKTCSISNIGRMTLGRWIEIVVQQDKSVDEALDIAFKEMY